MKKAGLFPTLAFSAMALVGCGDNDEPTENIEKKSQPDQELIEPPKSKCAREGSDEKKCSQLRRMPREAPQKVSQVDGVSPSDYEIG